MENVKFFQTEAERLADNGFPSPNVSYVEETNKTYYQQRHYTEAVGDILVTDGRAKQLITPTEYTDVWSKVPGITPIGILVIPSSHMPDGKLRVMSLVNMSPTTPDTGAGTSTSKTLCFGYTIATTTSYNKVVAIDENGQTIITASTQVLLPFEDGHYSTTDDLPHAPSPYLPDGSKNPIYFYNSTIDCINYKGNALSDVDGYGNTQKMLALATAQPNWKHDATITNANSTGYYPTACCCWRFHTAGTRHGQWYYPAIGEIGYYYVKNTTIDASITLHKNKKVKASLPNTLYSSTRNGNYIRGMGKTQNNVTYTTKRTSNAANRAFIKLSPQECC